MFDLTGLDALQDLDSRLDVIDRTIGEHRERMQRLEAELDAEKTVIDKKVALEKKITLRRKGNETELEALTDRRRILDVRLGSPGISPAQYEALQKELAALQPQIAKLEEAILTDMGKLEILARDVPKQSKILAGRREQVAIWKKEHVGEIDRLAAERELVATERQQVASKVVVATLEAYDELRRKYGGRVVFDLTGRNCPACGMDVPRSDLNRVVARPGVGLLCSSCGRILRWCGDADVLDRESR